MTRPRRSPAPLPEAALRQRLHARFWLRVHIATIALLTGGTTWFVSSLLLWLGLHSMPLRYALALGGGYAVYLLLLWWWARHLLRDESPLANSADAADLVNAGPGPGRSLDAGGVSLRSGGGGDFGGGGASGDFGPVDDALGAGAEAAGQLGGTLLEGAAAADEAAIVVLPLALVLAVAAALAAGLGVLVGGLFGVEILLAVAVEIAFASAAGSLALRARREGWLTQALRRTAWPMAFIALVAVLGGALLQYVAPQADSLPQAIRLWRAG